MNETTASPTQSQLRLRHKEILTEEGLNTAELPYDIRQQVKNLDMKVVRTKNPKMAGKIDLKQVEVESAEIADSIQDWIDNGKPNVVSEEEEKVKVEEQKKKEQQEKEAKQKSEQEGKQKQYEEAKRLADEKKQKIIAEMKAKHDAERKKKADEEAAKKKEADEKNAAEEAKKKEQEEADQKKAEEEAAAKKKEQGGDIAEQVQQALTDDGSKKVIKFNALKKILGREPNYPYEVVAGVGKLKKQFMREQYELVSE